MTNSTATVSNTRRDAAQRLPGRALFGLFLSGFVSILTEALPAGLLPQMSRTLHASVSLTGQTVTIYALATAAGAIPLARLTAKWDRKRVLQVALLIVAAANAATALTDSYALMMAIRFIAGLGTAMVWPLLGGYAAALAPEKVRGRAVAIALAGTPVSLALGIPLGTALGHLGGWQLAFYLSTALTLANMIWVQATLPALPGRAPGERPKFGATLRIPGLRLILLALAAYMVAHNIVYTYVTDYLTGIGMAEQAGWVLFAFGAAAILSVVVVGAHIDSHLRKLLIASTFVLGASVLVLAIFSGIPALIYIAAAAWGFAFGSSPSLFVGAAINATGPSADIAQAITITVFSGSIAAGALIGGLLIAGLGTISITWAALVLLVIAAALVLGGRKHAFPAGA
jgi:predicted MFS family arabinose efflux permease